MTTPAAPPVAEEVAAAHATAQDAIRAAALAQVLQVWLTMPRDLADLLTWWFGSARDDIYLYTAIGQELMASEAPDYVRDSLTLQGWDATVAQIDPVRFAGIASDGRDLDTLLDQAMWRTWTAREDGKSDAQARTEGEYALRRIVFQQITDAGREADQVVIVGTDLVERADPEIIENYIPAVPIAPRRLTRAEREQLLKERKRASPTPLGWIRMLTPPSCGRCAILAGRWYGWNDGFQRHDNCDCRHIPAPESAAGDLTVDPQVYFDSLSPEEQDYYFGVANAEAIRNGADMSQVINASGRKGATYTVDGSQYTREGTTRQGFYGRTPPGTKKVRRPTPLQIYRDSDGDREQARRALREFGYLVD